MQFNNDSDNQDIVSLVGDATGINTTAEIKQITRAVNRTNKIIWSWIFDVYGAWQYDDKNNSDLPTATTTLTLGQYKYTLPSVALNVKGVEIKTESGDWQKLNPLSIAEISSKTSEEDFFTESTGQPVNYAMISDVIKLYPKPDYTQASSLRIQFDRGSVSFVSTDTEKDAGFVSEFHEALADGASYYIGINKSLRNLAGLKLQWEQWEKKIKNFYAQRYRELYPKNVKISDYTNNVI